MDEPDGDEIFEQVARITSALASASRLKLLHRLCQGEQSVEQLAAGAGLTVANASRHLRILAQARLAASRRRSPYVYYALSDDAVGEFWLTLYRLARERLADIDRSINAYLAGDVSLTPVDREELLERLERGDVLVLDVRPEREYVAGHLPGAISIPIEELAERVHQLPADREIVAYCRGPYCFLSVDAVRLLRSAGRRASRLEDGVLEWKAVGLPVEVGAA